jgi:hypothetical protein
MKKLNEIIEKIKESDNVTIALSKILTGMATTIIFAIDPKKRGSLYIKTENGNGIKDYHYSEVPKDDILVGTYEDIMQNSMMVFNSNHVRLFIDDADFNPHKFKIILK